MHKYSRIFLNAIAASFAVWAFLAAFNLCGQRKLFLNEGREVLSDYWMPRMCIEQGYVGTPWGIANLRSCDKDEPIQIDERGVVRSTWYTDGTNKRYFTGWIDKVYPFFGILPLMPFPATEAGGWAWTIVAGIAFLLSLCLIAKSWWPLSLVLTAPFLFNLERGNTTWLSAALVGVFLAWWDDEKDWKCMVAAICLAAASAMKIAPVVLGLIYFSKWRWMPVIVCAIAGLTFLLLPWLLSSDGFAGLVAMIGNASRHGTTFLRASDFGIVPVWRAVRLLLGQDVTVAWPGVDVVARLTQLFGLANMMFAIRRRDYFLLVFGMILTAGNMYYYAALYLYPVLVLDMCRSKQGNCLEIFLWFILLCPIQIVLHGCSANQVLGDMALLSLFAVRAVIP